MDNATTEELTCPVCFDIFSNPHFLDCSHTVCLSCANKQSTSLEPSTGSGVQKPNSNQKAGFVCPVCQKVTQNVRSLIPNVAANEAVTTLKQIFLPNVAQSNVHCDACTTEKASLECEECGTSLCTKCSGTIHSLGKYKTHNVGPFGTLKKYLRCSKHDKVEEFWCENDSVQLCIYCVQLEGHKDHECIPIKEKLERVAKDVQAIITALQKQKTKIREASASLNDNLEQVEKSFQSAVSDVTTTFQQIRDALDKREQEIKGSLHKLKEELVTTIINRRKSLLSITNKSNEAEVKMQNTIQINDMKLMEQQKSLGEYVCWVIDKHLSELQYYDTTSFAPKFELKKLLEAIERFGSFQAQVRLLPVGVQPTQHSLHSAPTTAATTMSPSSTAVQGALTNATSPPSSVTTPPGPTTSSSSSSYSAATQSPTPTATSKPQEASAKPTAGPTKVQWVEVKKPLSAMKNAYSTSDLSTANPSASGSASTSSAPSSTRPLPTLPATNSSESTTSASSSNVTSTSQSNVASNATANPTSSSTTPSSNANPNMKASPILKTSSTTNPQTSTSAVSSASTATTSSSDSTGSGSTATAQAGSRTEAAASSLSSSSKSRPKSTKKPKHDKRKSKHGTQNKDIKALPSLPNFPNIRQMNSKDDFAMVIANETEKLIVVHFSAEWCPHFKNVAPKMEELAAKNTATAGFYTLDIEKISGIAQLCGVSSIPTFHFFRKKRKITELVGADLERLEALVKYHLETTHSEQKS